MNAQRTTLAAALLATAVFAPHADLGAARSASPVEVHEQLIEALDRGDGAAVEKLLDAAPLLFVVDQHGQPVTLSGQHSAGELVSLWAHDVEDAESTKLLSCSVVADGPASCTVIFELERPKSVQDVLRGTSLLEKTDGENGKMLEIQHLHVSPAGREDY